MNRNVVRRLASVAGFVAGFWLVTARSSAEWINCGIYSTNLADAAGYPGLDRRYKLWTTCRYQTDYNSSGGLNFSIHGAAKWDGTTQQLSQAVTLSGDKIQGGQLEISGICPFDPFLVGKYVSCTSLQWKGDIDSRILSALYHANGADFFFRNSVDPEQALVLSKKHESTAQNTPPPPPAPKLQIPRGQEQPSGPAKAISPVIPVPASGQKRPDGGGSAKSAGGVIVAVTPSPPPTRALARRVEPPTPTPTATPATRRRS